MYKRVIKRGLDIVLALVGMILASWLFLLIAIAIRIDDPGPPSGIRKISLPCVKNTARMI